MGVGDSLGELVRKPEQVCAADAVPVAIDLAVNPVDVVSVV
ncbi:hypothetical protein [uncultured Cutibacterium sp.]|nr:hypothetical protein [uncultured Cutibacterium sp.]